MEAETFPHESSRVVANVCLTDSATGDHSRRDGSPDERLFQLASMHPLAKRFPLSRLARKSALAWIRLDLGKLVNWPEAVICAGKGVRRG